MEMKCDKEWLKEKISTMFDRGTVERVHNLIDQLDEPNKVVIPQFVAGWWERDGDSVTLYGGLRVKKKHKFDLVSNYHDKGLADYLSKAEEWIDENNSIFLDLVNGKPYDIEKEKLYYVKLPNTNSESEYLYLAQGSISGDCWFNSRLERLDYESDAYNHQFTEKEIKSIDPRYWQFAEPVEESP